MCWCLSHLIRGRLNETHALRVRTDLRCVQSILGILNDLGPLDVRNLSGSTENGRCSDTLALATGHVPHVKSSSHCRCWHAPLRSLLDGPPTRALHASLVQDLVHQEAIAGEVVCLGHNYGSDLHQETLQLTAVPISESLRGVGGDIYDRLSDCSTSV